MEQTVSPAKSRPALIQAIIAYVIFCGLSLLSRVIPPLFIPVILFGLAFPILWARFAHTKFIFGFRQPKAGVAVLWGLAVGIAIGLYTYMVAIGLMSFLQYTP